MKKGKEKEKQKKSVIDELIFMDLMEDGDCGGNSGCLVFILGVGLVSLVPIILAAVILA